jgi:hypothetical protein
MGNPHPQANFQHKFVAIILSYLRPQNIQRICAAILELQEVSRIIVSNNNPDIDLKKFLTLKDKRIQLIEQTMKAGSIKRYEIANSISSEMFFSIDDDLFLNKDQIRYLLLKLMENPSAPHGFWGQNYAERGGQILFQDGLVNRETHIDILNRAYFFTHQHSKELMALVGRTNTENVGPCDDLFLSFSGDVTPFSHDIGGVHECPTSNEKGIAQWQDPDFLRKRARVLKQILLVKRMRGVNPVQRFSGSSNG